MVSLAYRKSGSLEMGVIKDFLKTSCIICDAKEVCVEIVEQVEEEQALFTLDLRSAQLPHAEPS